jgi:hypothetical protein
VRRGRTKLSGHGYEGGADTTVTPSGRNTLQHVASRRRENRLYIRPLLACSATAAHDPSLVMSRSAVVLILAFVHQPVYQPERRLSRALGNRLALVREVAHWRDVRNAKRRAA